MSITRGRLLLNELAKHDGAVKLFGDLLFCCDVSIVGGAVRTALTEYKTPIKDFDLCIIVRDRQEYRQTIEKWSLECNMSWNHYGGLKIELPTVDFDIWELKNSFAKEQTFESLSYASHLNFDGIVFDYARDILYDKPFQECINSNTIRVQNTEKAVAGYNERKSKKYSELWGFDVDLGGVK